MRTSILILSTVMAAFFLNGCKTNAAADAAHNSKNSVDWMGIYKGSVAAGDNKEKVTIITLENDLSYRMQSAITDEYDQAADSKGTFSWSKNGNEITLKDATTGNTEVYKVGENQLIEKSGNRLLKLQKEKVTEKYWKLIELRGQAVSEMAPTNREPFIILKEQDSRVTGSGGCNTLTGAYVLNEATSRIKFEKIASTMMACLNNMELEGNFLKVLEEVDNYSLSADGTQLSLNKARMAPLARFEVVYLR